MARLLSLKTMEQMYAKDWERVSTLRTMKSVERGPEPELEESPVPVRCLCESSESPPYVGGGAPPLVSQRESPPPPGVDVFAIDLKIVWKVQLCEVLQ